MSTEEKNMETMIQEKEDRKSGKSPKWLWILLMLILLAGVSFFSFNAGRNAGSASHAASALTEPDPAESTGTGLESSREEIFEKLSIFDMYVDNYYLNDVDEEKVVDGIYDGYLKGLDDPYAEYYSEKEYKDLMEEDSGEYQGIGVLIYEDPDTGYPTIDGVFRDSPAFKAGIQVGDRIISVNDRETIDMDLQEVVNEIRRSDRKTADLKIYRDGNVKEFTVKKEKVQIETVEYEMKDNQVGYIAVTQFIDNTDELFEKALKDLSKQKMKGLIIDLRNNGGGLVNTCTNMLSRIVPEGDLLVYTQDKQGNRNEYKSTSKATVDVPIVILVNGNSASASEIMTGCLKDYKLATIVGSKTYGKGIVQNIFPLSDGTALKFTTAKYYTPNGKNIHEIGIEPDIKVELDDEAYREALEDESKDTQLKKAMEILTKK
ncbi:MAG: S41 family peptidase [Eubacterium sp.]|nr:S41 family peptidase [Eubacterium sp.]